jgi:dienelactone hydrolase
VNATTEDFASDVTVAFNYLKSQVYVDKKRIALIGHSEGGIIAPMVAANDKTVGAIVLMAERAWKGVNFSNNRTLTDEDGTDIAGYN